MKVLGFGVVLLSSLALSGILNEIAVAQPGATIPSSGITAVASETVAVKAERLRLIMLIKAKGADPKGAIMALSEHKQRVQKELEAMKADKASIAFTSPRLTSGDSGDASRMQQVQIQMQMQMANAGAAVVKPTIPTVHTAMCALKVEWPLPASEGDALTLLPATLSEQVKARDLAGENNKPKLSKEAQVQLEELEGMVPQSFSFPVSNEQTSKILFVASVPDDARQKTIAAAFAKATKEVDTLAASTGQKRGKLISLSTDSAQNPYAQMFRSAYGGYVQDGSAVGMMSKFESDESTVTNVNSDDLALTVSVSVVYAID